MQLIYFMIVKFVIRSNQAFFLEKNVRPYYLTHDAKRLNFMPENI